ncbi:MAG: SUF system NifU family Fe-S cluster assembly protein [Chloroflexi bacterium RBG_16_56_8]|nr:MAG: SUF system NifU family Fe-S cluster assembly protein [Chloroflexi bacterium RBG_16_56_8]
MDDLYRELILDHYQHPHNHGEIPGADISYEDSNPLCGDKIRIDIKLKDNVVEDVKFNGKGCAISQASASMLTDELIGKSLDDIKKMDKQFILDLLGIPLGPTRIKCALLPLKVIKAGAYGVNNWGDEDEE